MTYTQSQQGYYSPTHPNQFPGDDKKGQPINGKKEWVYPILSEIDGQLAVQKVSDPTKEGAIIPIKEYLAP